MRHQYFSFTRASFTDVVAHDGSGRIRTARVIDEAHSAFRFIDLTELPPGSSVGVHTHADDEEVYVIISGRGRMMRLNQLNGADQLAHDEYSSGACPST